MDKKSAIFTRRSVRVYDPSKRATKEQILDILDAAMHAPTAMNKQPWEFVVATDPEVVSGITKIHPYCEFLPDAGSAIIVRGNLKEQFEIPEGGYYQYDCSAAAQNILLRAKELGLDTCWCGIAPEKTRMDAFKKFFGCTPGSLACLPAGPLARKENKSALSTDEDAVFSLSQDTGH